MLINSYMSPPLQVFLLVVFPLSVNAFVKVILPPPPPCSFGSRGAPRPIPPHPRTSTTLGRPGPENSRRCAIPTRSASSASTTPSPNDISVEYCIGCQWMLRSAWLAQELLTTFPDELDSVTLIPSRPPAPGGVFKVRHNTKKYVVWDRTVEEGFPEAKELKQRIRDLIAPEKGLGHSDRDLVEDHGENAIHVEQGECIDCSNDDRVSRENPNATVVSIADAASDMPAPNVAISYCTGCRWMLRSAWIMQELLTTFDTEINSVTLIPSRPPAQGGEFTVTLDGETLWDRSEEGAFPQPKYLKQNIRDRISPQRDLGHSDVEPHSANEKDELESTTDLMDDDEASEMRKYFGVM